MAEILPKLIKLQAAEMGRLLGVLCSKGIITAEEIKYIIEGDQAPEEQQNE